MSSLKSSIKREEVFGSLLQICEDAIKKWDEEEALESPKDRKIRLLQAALDEERDKPRRGDSSFSRMA